MNNYKTLRSLVSILLIVATLFSLAALTACDDKTTTTTGGNGQKDPADVTSDSLYVKKVENLSDDFIMGMDASCVPSLEASGVKYYDHDGNEKDVYQILAENGINYIRVRVWNDPFDADGNGYGGGNCDIDNAIAIGKRATQYGMKLLVNFHYSDFWADPAKQMVPKAWKGMDVAQMSEALYAYTKESLQKLVNAGVDVGMVQIGNETNGYMCGIKKWSDIAQLMNAGSRATREVCPDALVAVHFTNPENEKRYPEYAWYLATQHVDYDVFASSYYPFWHGTLENLSSLLSEIATTYNKKVMVAETSYAFSELDTDFQGNTISSGSGIVKNYPFTAQGQANLVHDVIETVANTTNGIGVFYWEGTWISVGGENWEENSKLWEQHGSGWASSYAAGYDPNDAGKYYGGCSVDNQAFFDKDGKALESLKVFSLVRKGNEIELKADAIEDVNLIVDLNGDIVLPKTVNAVMSDNSKKTIPVEWEAYDEAAMKAGGVAKYTIKGVAGGMTANCYVSMVEYNFLQNWSFDDNTDGSPWVATPTKAFDELYVEDKVTDSMTGTKHYHFWSSTSAEFTLEQQVDNLKAGKYKYSISIMGGDAGEETAYIYVKINGEIVATAPIEITVYNEWHTATISEFSVNNGDVVTVGIYVNCPGSGNGPWGKIDDALLNSIKE